MISYYEVKYKELIYTQVSTEIVRILFRVRIWKFQKF